jgi:hypothetical protein
MYHISIVVVHGSLMMLSIMKQFGKRQTSNLSASSQGRAGRGVGHRSRIEAIVFFALIIQCLLPRRSGWTQGEGWDRKLL